MCRALWFFHAMKEQRRKTTNKIYDKSNKVKNCGTILGLADPALCILRQLLTFELWIYIPFQVVLFLSFRADEKKQKARHRVKNCLRLNLATLVVKAQTSLPFTRLHKHSQCSLLRNCFAISFGRTLLVVQAFSFLFRRSGTRAVIALLKKI